MKNFPIALAYFSKTTDTAVKPHPATTWHEWRDYLADSQEIEVPTDATATELEHAKKSCEGYAPAIFETHQPNAQCAKNYLHRCDAGVTAITAIVLDIDHIDYNTIKDRFAAYEHCAHTTFSHTADDPRWRVVLPIAEPIPIDTYLAKRKAISAHFGNIDDDSCHNASRFYFRSTHRRGTKPEWRHSPAPKLLNINDLPPYTGTATTNTISTTATTVDPLTDPDFQDLRGNFRTVTGVHEWWLEKVRNGKSRHKTAYACIAALRKLNLQQADTKDALDRLRRNFIEAVTKPPAPIRSKAQAEREWSDLLKHATARVDADQETTTAPAQNATTTDSEGEKKPRKTPNTHAKDILAIAQRRYRFTTGGDGIPLAVPTKGSPIATTLNAPRFRSELNLAYKHETGNIASRTELDNAIGIMEAYAHQAEPETVYLRTADLGDRIIIDPCHPAGHVYEIDRNGWRKLPTSPVVFRRTEALARMVEPTTGDINPLRQHANMTDADFQLTMGWATASVFDKSPPILVPNAPQGAGKTMFTRRVKQLLDPSEAEILNMPNDPETWRLYGSNSHIIALDNISHISPTNADTLSRMVTGYSDMKRLHYTNNTPGIYKQRRPIIITSIDLGKIPPDLAERMLTITLTRIPDDQRKTEAELDTHFTQHAGNILGGIFDLTAGILAHLHHRPPPLTRNADFAHKLHALDMATGWHTLDAYRQRVSEGIANTIDGDPLIEALVTHLDLREIGDTRRIPSAELHQQLRQHFTSLGQDQPRALNTPQTLGSRLSKDAVALSERHGIAATLARNAGKRIWQFTRITAPSDGMTA